MSWRDLFFVGLMGGAIAWVATSLLPSRTPAILTQYDSSAYQSRDFTTLVQGLDTAFQNDWASEKLIPAPRASELAIARRLSLALVGTVPSLEEIRRFEALPSGKRLPWFIDQLLASRRFADYFAERFARMTIGQEEGPLVLFRRRRYVAWLSDAIFQNRPYDQVARDIISEQGLWTDHPATNFITVTSTEEKKNQPDPIRLAGRTTRAFLGLRIDCAQCHDHPFASWKQGQFEGLAAYFGQTHVGFSGVYDEEGEYKILDPKTSTERTIPPSVPFHPELLPTQGTRREQLAAWVTSEKNPYFAKATANRIWALMTGTPMIAPVDNIETDQPTPPALNMLAHDFASHGFDLRRLIRVIAMSQVFQLDSSAPHEITEAHERAWAVFRLTRLRPEQVSGSVLQAASLTTNDAQAHILLRLMRYGQQNDFLERYSDNFEDELDNRGGTIPQRLLLMNGELVRERLKQNPLNANIRIGQLTANNDLAVEASFLATLTRRPTHAEKAHFVQMLTDTSSELNRSQRMEDLYWALINCTEFSWNH
jgi:hypothetical protein